MDRLFRDSEGKYVTFDALLGNPLTVFGQIASAVKKQTSSVQLIRYCGSAKTSPDPARNY